MNCPSCAAPLDSEGVCTACGALARGFFRGLDLGAPQIAAAVARGLDFYHLLGVAPAAPIRQVVRRYRQLRALFPDDPSGLAPEPARRLALLETAGRALTDPALRRTYDQLRAERQVEVRAEVLRCAGCTAPLDPGAARCPYCGTQRPAEPAPPSAPLPGGPPAAEPEDFYALIGLHPAHLIAAPPSVMWGGDGLAWSAAGRLVGRRVAEAEALSPAGPPAPHDVDAAAYARERETLLAPGLAPEQREERAAQIELARRILRDERRRARYDLLWRALQQGTFTAGHLEGLSALQDEVRAEVAAERGEALSEEQAAALLRQGRGYLDAGLPREAVEALRRAVAALPRTAEAHRTYVRAILASADPLDLGGHMLRQALASVEAAEALGAPLENGAALAALCRGLLARDGGDVSGAQRLLRAAVQSDAQLAPAWRGLAALALYWGDDAEALACCRRALALAPRDERALLMVVAACLHAGHRDEARVAAAQVAALRGEGWTAEAVLHELR
jgi:tetratricopeptide (TPR) repeat protein